MRPVRAVLRGRVHEWGGIEVWPCDDRGRPLGPVSWLDSPEQLALRASQFEQSQVLYKDEDSAQFIVTVPLEAQQAD